MEDIRQLSQYSPEGIEKKWYEAWEKARLNAVQDVLIRWARMSGRPTLWVPGTDHASIATEQVVSRQMAAEGMPKREAGREKFLTKAWDWKEKTHSRITQQIRRLGCSGAPMI